MAVARRINLKRAQQDRQYDPPWFFAATSQVQAAQWRAARGKASKRGRTLSAFFCVMISQSSSSRGDGCDANGGYQRWSSQPCASEGTL